VYINPRVWPQTGRRSGISYLIILSNPSGFYSPFPLSSACFLFLVLPTPHPSAARPHEAITRATSRRQLASWSRANTPHPVLHARTRTRTHTHTLSLCLQLPFGKADTHRTTNPELTLLRLYVFATPSRIWPSSAYRSCSRAQGWRPTRPERTPLGIHL